jgi:hypothetical protein
MLCPSQIKIDRAVFPRGCVEGCRVPSLDHSLYFDKIRLSHDSAEAHIRREAKAMPLGDGQKNNLLNLTMDLWEGQVFFEGQAYPAGYFAASVMNRTAEENTALLVKAGQLLRDMDAFTRAGSDGERAAPEKIKPQLLSLLDDIWRIEPFSQMDEANERATIETIFADPFWEPVLQDGTRERRFFLRYAESLIRVSQAVVNFDSVAWTLEAFYLHRLKRRSETFYVHAVMDCFRRPELWNEIQKHGLLPVENFTLSPQLQAGTALMRHPAKDQTMVLRRG